MRNLMLMGFIVAVGTACSTSPQQDSITPPKVGLANPASAYCIAQGGQLHIQNEANGQVGYCTLADGQVVEEWALFRASQKCVAEKAESLVGQTGLTESQIRQISQAGEVRQLAPNQPMTMDYRESRVTLLVEPASGQIIKASCG